MDNVMDEIRPSPLPGQKPGQYGTELLPIGLGTLARPGS